MEGDLGNSMNEMDGWDGSDESSDLRGSSETSEITLEDGNSSDFAWKDENAAEGIQRGESMSTEWTDEKHSMFLNSIEASFVKQLYHHKYQWMDLHGRLSRKQKLLNQNSLQSNTGGHSSSGQFKVLHRGCWEKLYFGTNETQLGTENEYQHLLGNLWIKHFRSTSRGKRLEENLPGPKNKNFGGGSLHLGRLKNGTTACGLASSSKQPRNHCIDIYSQDSVSGNTEMSDQNFADDGHDDGEQELTSLCTKKKPRTAAVDDFSKDQVVPSGKSLVAVANTSENYAFQQNIGEDYMNCHSEKKTESGRMKSVPPSFEDP